MRGSGWGPATRSQKPWGGGGVVTRAPVREALFSLFIHLKSLLSYFKLPCQIPRSPGVKHALLRPRTPAARSRGAEQSFLRGAHQSEPCPLRQPHPGLSGYLCPSSLLYRICSFVFQRPALRILPQSATFRSCDYTSATSFPKISII